MKPTEDDGKTPATPPQRWVCTACGKTSSTRYGFDSEQRQVADPGWDESCMLHAMLCEPAPLRDQLMGGSKWKVVGD